MTLEELKPLYELTVKDGFLMDCVCDNLKEALDLAEAMLMLEEMRRPTLTALGWAKQEDREWICDVSSHNGDDQEMRVGAAAAIRAAYEEWKR